MRLDDHLRQIDPVDADAPVPDGEALLERILASPVPVRRRAPRRPLRAPLALAGVACLLAAGVVLALPRGAPTDALAAAYKAVSEPGTILHYREHWVSPRTRVSPYQDLNETEVWQASDGSRGREIQSLPAQGSSGPMQTTPRPASTWEYVWSGEGTRSWDSLDKDTIVFYDARHAPEPPSPGAADVGNRQIGDPRTLLNRARSNDSQVTQLPDGTVRGIPVLRFRVGSCKLTHTGPNAWSMRWAAVVSIDRDSHLPVRVEQPPCRDAPAGQKGLTTEEMPGLTVDYLSFEVLPGDAANQRMLDMSAHPGAKLVDGHAIDVAEARHDKAQREADNAHPVPPPAP
jgi:hypothetical protein